MRNETSCTKLQLPPEHMTRGPPPPDPHSICPLSSNEFLETPSPPNKIRWYATAPTKLRQGTQISSDQTPPATTRSIHIMHIMFSMYTLFSMHNIYSTYSIYSM